MTEAHQQQESDPIEEEGRQEGREEDKVVAQQTLIGDVSGGVFSLVRLQGDQC